MTVGQRQLPCFSINYDLLQVNMADTNQDLYNWQPDPAWDYAQIWDYLGQMQTHLAHIRAEIAQLKNASPESYVMVQRRLQEIQILCFRAIAHQVEHPPNQNN